MPTYEYECPKCGHRFEAFQSITARPLSKCEKCGKKPRRLVSAGAGFIFKGSGFYITDYRSKEYKEKAKAESGGGAGSSEAKPAGKSESKSAASDAKPAKESPKAKD